MIDYLQGLGWGSIYIIVSSVVMFVSIIKLPTSMHPIDNVGGSIVAAIAFGWLLWPVALIAAIKTRNLNPKVS